AEPMPSPTTSTMPRGAGSPADAIRGSIVPAGSRARSAMYKRGRRCTAGRVTAARGDCPPPPRRALHVPRTDTSWPVPRVCWSASFFPDDHREVRVREADANPPAGTMGFREFVALMAALMAVNALSIDAMLPVLPQIGETL